MLKIGNPFVDVLAFGALAYDQKPEFLEEMVAVLNK
jgi:hypothetical protein